MVAQYANSHIVCGFFLSWWGGPSQSFEHSIWDHVGFYTIHTFLDPSVESQFRIISKSHNSLFGTTTTPSNTFSNSHFSSGQSRQAFSPSIVLYLWLGARRPTAQSYNSSSVSWYYLVWPLRLLRGNSAYEKHPCEAQWQKCCLYETPYYVATPIRETGDVIAHLQEPDFFKFTSNAFLKRPFLLKYWLLHPRSTRKPLAKAVPSKDYFTHMKT